MGEEHGRATRAQGGQGGLGERAAADAIEDCVGTPAVLAVCHRSGEQRLSRSDGVVRAEGPGEPAAVLARVDDHDPNRRIERPQNEEMEQAHAAAAQNRGEPPPAHLRGAGRSRGGEQERALAQAPEDTGRGLEEESVEVVEGIGQPASGRCEGAGADQNLPGEAPGHEQVLAEGRTLGLRAARAVEALPAGGVVGHDEAIGRRQAADLLADRKDLTHDLVPEHDSGRRRTGRQFEEIGAAEPAPAQAQDELVGSRQRVGEVAQARPAAVVDGDGLHRGVSFHQMERRIHRRFPRRIELRYWRPGETQGHTAYTTNISKSGLFLSSSTSLMSGERLRLEILDRESGFFAEGRVTRIHRVPLALRHVDQQGVGVRFLLPEELVENLVPLARQSGPATQGGKEVEPGALVPDEQGGAVAGGEAAAQPAMDIDRDRIVPIAFADPSAFLSTYHRDICAGGLFISTPTPMALQEAVWIEMRLPIPGEPPKLFPARVVQRFDPLAAVGSGMNLLSGMAVQFTDPEKVLAELKPLLEALRR
jgi:Tfp pilus assembly protein PilZ